MRVLRARFQLFLADFSCETAQMVQAVGPKTPLVNFILVNAA